MSHKPKRCQVVLESTQNIKRFIGAAIVDDDDFEISHGRECSVDLLKQKPDVLRLIVNGYDYRHSHHAILDQLSKLLL